jgi:hypothetical protein
MQAAKTAQTIVRDLDESQRDDGVTGKAASCSR